MRAYSSRATGPLTHEEIDVKSALSSYTTAGASRADRVRASVLWKIYCDWWAANRWRWKRPYDTVMGEYPRLSRKQFGAALRRVFPGLVRERFMFKRKRYYTYTHLRVAD